MTRQVLTAFIGFAAVLAAAPLSLRAQEPSSSPVVTSNPLLEARLARLSLGSPSWRDALDAVARTGRRVVVVTPESVRVRDQNGKAKPFDPDVLAEVQPIGDGKNVDTVVVVINLPLLERLYSDTIAADMHADLDRILAHEVYGHAIPYVLAGDLSGKCADPMPGQRATDACAIQRENIIRSELRLGQRRSYGLDGLAIARRFRN